MGREIRRVPCPAEWEHPKQNMPYGFDYKPLMDGYNEKLEAFRQRCLNYGFEDAIEYYGGGPQRDDYVDYAGAEATWYQVYETVSEGTPVTPPFATQDELIHYLTTQGDFWSQRSGDKPYSLEAATNFVKGGGYAPSMVFSPEKGLQSGIESLGN